MRCVETSVSSRNFYEEQIHPSADKIDDVGVLKCVDGVVVVLAREFCRVRVSAVRTQSSCGSLALKIGVYFGVFRISSYVYTC